MIYGCDISEYQGDLSWDGLSTLGFVIVRSSYGATGVDKQFVNNQRKGRASGKPLGYYHYAYADRGNAPQTEADHFVNTVGPLQQGEIMCLDWEEPYAGNQVNWCLGFLQRVYARTRIKSFIYMDLAHVRGSNWGPVITGGYPLWLAAWQANMPATTWPAPLWQNGDQGPAGGDSDRFFGTVEGFKQYGSGGGPPPTEQEDDDEMYEAYPNKPAYVPAMLTSSQKCYLDFTPQTNEPHQIRLSFMCDDANRGAPNTVLTWDIEGELSRRMEVGQQWNIATRGGVTVKVEVLAGAHVTVTRHQT